MANRPDEVTVKLKANVYRMVKMVAAWKGQLVIDYLSGVAEVAAKKDLQAFIAGGGDVEQRGKSKNTKKRTKET